jgi:hypothetical protein
VDAAWVNLRAPWRLSPMEWKIVAMIGFMAVLIYLEIFRETL